MNVLLSILTHGDETVGIKVARHIGKLAIVRGTLVIHRANELAHKKRKRFIDEDLNRVFPGKKKGTHEQMLAYKIAPKVKEADLVIDIHSTRSGLKDALIVTKLTKKTREYVKIIAPKYLLYMRATKSNALMSGAKVGIAFEYGKNSDAQALRDIVEGITRLLVHLGMVEGAVKSLRRKPIEFDVYGTVPKPPGARLLSRIKNYQRIREGEGFASVNGEMLRAKKDFYPILFGENSYKEVFGFCARRLR